MLKEEHREQLLASAIPEKAIDYVCEQGGLESVDEGLKFHYFHGGRPNGFYRVRLDRPTDKTKYIQPAGTGTQIYVLPHQPNANQVLITEGEKKTMSAWARLAKTVRVIGIGGAWNWGKGDGDTKNIHDQLSEAIGRNPANVRVCFDSDTAHNAHVSRAECRLLSALRGNGHRASVIILPEEHKGLDDWLYAWGDKWPSELRKLWHESVPARPQYDYETLYARPYSFQEMLQSRFPEPVFFLGNKECGLVGEGMVTFVHGRTNVGKTYFAVQLAVSISSGVPFLGYRCQPAKVLYLQGELSPGLYAEGRLRPLADQLGFVPGNIEFYNWSFNLASTDRWGKAPDDAWVGFGKLHRLLDEVRPKVLVIDPLQVYNNLTESNTDQNRELMKRMKDLATRRNIAIIITDHIRKPAQGGESDSIYAMRGSGTKADLADTVMSLQWNIKDKAYYLCFDKVRYISSKRPEPIMLKRNGTVFEVTEVPF
jgi:hypothetical protein